MSSNIFIQSGTSYYPGLFDTNNYLTLSEADFRYIKKGTDANYNIIAATSRIELESTDATLITATSNCDQYGLHLHSLLGSSNGKYSGSSIAFNNSSSDNVPLSSICLDKIGSGSGELVFAVRNGSDCNERMRIRDTGIDITGGINTTSIINVNTDVRHSVSISNSNVNRSANVLFTCVGVDAAEIGVRGSNDTNPRDFYIWKSGFRLTFANADNLCRIYGGCQIDGSLGLNVAINPSYRLNVSGSVNVLSGFNYHIDGQSIDTRYLRTNVDSTSTAGLRLYSTALSGGVQTLLRLGHSTAGGDWFIRHYRDPAAENNTLEMLNTNSSLFGLSIGTFNGTSNGDGCMLVMNGSQGSGTFISANQPAANGALHLNCGIPQAVPAGWTFDSIGERSNSGGTVSISLYSYQNAWIRGALYCTSDKRLKNVHAPIDSQKAMNLLKITPTWYSWKSDKNEVAQLGVIAQDLLANDLSELTHQFNNEDVVEEDTEHGIQAGKQLVVSYDRIPLYLLEIIKKQQKDIEKLIGLLPPGKRKTFESSNIEQASTDTTE